MNYLFWCEFPERINWRELNKFFRKHDFHANIGVTCTSREDFFEKESFIHPLSNIHVVRAWPVLPKKAGYWFSSYSSRKAIDSLDQYRGIPIKLDIEPPLPKGSSKNPYLVFWLLLHTLFSGANSRYLQRKIKMLSHSTDVMLSTFSFPKFALRNLGMVFSGRLHYNYIYYSSFAPKFLRPLYRAYLKRFVRKMLEFDPETFFAVGLLSPGIFGDEPLYRHPKELAEDLFFLRRCGVRNIAVFQLDAFQRRITPEAWVKVLKKFQ